jgi:hypothetical protein
MVLGGSSLKFQTENAQYNEMSNAVKCPRLRTSNMATFRVCKLFQESEMHTG